jgi:hypothetical protein
MIYKKWIIMGIFLLIIWGSFLLFVWLKTDEITKDPCSVCAKRMGEVYSCYGVSGTKPMQPITFYPNGTISQTSVIVVNQGCPCPNLNFSGLN